ncbi:MAG: ATP-binding protein [bacterium]
MDIIKRNIENKIENWLFKGKIIIVYGARQVGKTTLCKAIMEKYKGDAVYFNCEVIQIKQALEIQDPVELKKFLGDSKLIILDEAQSVRNIGLSLKLLIDTYPDMQIIATGSSSFDLSNKISEPLTGRSIEFTLYPFSISELQQVYKPHELKGQINTFLRFGMYPEVVKSGQENGRIFLENIASKYLYKDVLEFEEVKRSDLLVSLLQLLALQLGNEVSYHELSKHLKCDPATVRRYIDILEKAFVIFRLKPFSRNLRNEIGKKNKIYFYDLGIRNSLIGRYEAIEKRDDVGALWENFCIIERLKRNQLKDTYGNKFFWRTHDGYEVDYIEEYDGILHGYEFKWNSKRSIRTKRFLEEYKESSVKSVNIDNYYDFIIE